MSLYTKARKHINMNRVKELHEKKITERIALQEQQYLLHFTQNVVPKHYDWRTGKFNENSLSLMQVNDIVLKRLEEIDDALSEGMTTKDFSYLYGGTVVSDIVSINPELVSSTFAQDLISASGEVTSHMFGPDFPGSHINSIGDFGKPESLSKVDAQAHITTNHEVTPNQGEMAHPEKHVFTYQSEGNSIKWPTEFTLPDSFNDDLMWFDAEGNPQEWIHYIWPVHGHPGNYTPLDSDDDQTPFWYDPHPHDTPGSAWGHNSETDSDDKLRQRVTLNDGRIDRRSITDTSFDVTYGAARSIDSSSFDLAGNMDSEAFATGSETDYGVDTNDTAALNALRLQWDKPRTEPGHEDWQYIRSGTSTGYIDQLYGIDFPFAEYDYSPYEEDHDQFTGTDGWTRIHPNLNTDASFAKKIIKNVQVGDKISFSYKWYSDTWLYNTENYTDYYAEDYIHDGVRYGDHDWNPAYFRAVIGASNRVVSIKDQFQMIGADPSLTLTDGTYTIPPLPNPNNPQDNDLYNNHNITKKDNGFSFPYNGTYEYTVQEGDIDAAGLFQFTTILLAESLNLEYVQITNFAHTESDRTAAGQLGKTTDAYNLGTSVASLNPNEKYQKNKKKKDKEEQERRKIEQERLKKEKQEKEQEQKDTETEDTITKGGKTYDKETYSALGAYAPSVDEVKDYPTYSDIKGQTEPPEPGSYYYTTYHRFYVPKEGSEYQAWLSSIPKEQADKIRDAKQKADPAANQRNVDKFQMFGKPKLYGKYGDRSYYNPADTGQEVDNQVKITWDQYGAPKRQDRFGQRLANPGEKQDSYGFPLGKDEEESDYTYWKGKRYLKGSYDDTAEIDPKTGKFRGNFSWFAEKDPASAKTGNSDTMSTTKNWKGPKSAWKHREGIGLGPNEEIEQVIQYRKHRDLMREKYGRLRDIPKQYHKNNNYLESLNRLVVATMPKDWARPFVPADGDKPVDDEPQFDKEKLDIEDFENKSDFDAYKAGGGDAARKDGMSVEDIIAQGRKNLESSDNDDNDDPYHLNLGQIIKKFGKKVGDELAKISQKLSTYRHAGAAFANFLLQQQGITNYTKKNPYKVKLPRKDALALAKTFNRVLETQIPRERWNDLSQKDLDLLNNAANPESGPTPTNKYRRGTGPNRDEYHNIFNNLGERKGIKVKVINGKPYVTELNDNYVFTDPDDATVKGAPELIKFFTTAAGAQKRKGAAGGGKYTYQQFSGNIDELDLKMKNMPIRMRLPTPVSEELYPGQPSPNGFPDTPPPKMAPNGYHPEYGKQAKRYRKLDPVSAVVMNKVKTDDPETNKLVAAAAKKPKVQLVPNTRNKKDKVSEAVWPKALRHINMDRVKELREENIKKQKLAEEKLQEEILRAHVEMIRAHYSKHYDWRRELEEGMTTADMGMINLPADPDTIQTSIPSTSITSADNVGDPDENGIVIRNQSFQVVDATKTDTITLTISGSFTTKTVDGMELNDKVSIGVKVGGTYVGNYLAGGGNTGLGNGTHTITIPQRFRKAGVRFDAIQITAFEGESGTVSITGAGLKRVNPINILVSLDDPEATAFIRDALGNENLSPAQKKKKIEQMLGASAEYLTKMFGEGIFTGATEISDIQVQQSFTQIAQGLPYVDEDDAYDDDYYQGPVPDYMDDSDVDLPIELAKKTSDNPADWPSRHDLPTGPQGPSKDIPWVPEAPKANKKKSKQPQYAHYEPEGEVIVEKKKLKSPKSLLDKIPGYYDGKPAPLGFPIEEPPKMKNGMHPDLVDGKKVANRYNRLDPTSAKAMPKTGNPHIDKKVRAAAKKPK